MEGWLEDWGEVAVETGGRVAFGRAPRLLPWDCVSMAKLMEALDDPSIIVSGVETGWSEMVRPDFLFPAVCLAASMETDQASLFSLEPDHSCLIGFRVKGFEFQGISFERALEATLRRLRDGKSINLDPVVDAFGKWLQENNLLADVGPIASLPECEGLAPKAEKAAGRVMRLDPTDRWLRERCMMGLGEAGFGRLAASLVSAACVSYSSSGRLDHRAVSLCIADTEFMEARFRQLLARAKTAATRGDASGENAVTILTEAASLAGRVRECRAELLALSAGFRLPDGHLRAVAIHLTPKSDRQQTADDMEPPSPGDEDLAAATPEPFQCRTTVLTDVYGVSERFLRLADPLPVVVTDKLAGKLPSLREGWPWLSRLWDFVASARQTASGRCLPPVLIVGEPGCGKTSAAIALAESLGPPVRILRGIALADFHPITGYGPYQHLASVAVEAMLAGEVANPVVVIDDCDCFEGIANGLIPMLEGGVQHDHTVGRPVNLSGVTWILTASSKVKRQLRSRCRVFTADTPDLAAAVAKSAGIVAAERGMDPRLLGRLAPDETEAIMRTMDERTDLHALKRTMEAFLDGRDAAAGRH